MCFELATYGVISGLLYAKLSRSVRGIYLSLAAAMLAGRIIWGCVMALISGAGESAFTWTAFLAGAFTGAVPGIVLHLLLIPVIVMALERAGLLKH